MQNDITQQTMDAIGSKAGSIMTYGGSGGAVLAGLSVSDWGVIVGIVVAIIGLAVQIYFKRREDQRQARYWALRAALGANHDLEYPE